MTTAATPSPEPTPEEIQRAIAGAEQMLAIEAQPRRDVRWGDLVEPVEATEAPAGNGLDEDEAIDAELVEADDKPLVIDLAEGETRWVKQLRQEVAEAHLVAQLQSDDTPIVVDTRKVRKRRRAAYEAARLHELAQDPVMRAWQAARMRRLLVTAGMVSLTLALAWSTAGVQVFAAEGAPSWSPAWIVAWLVEPFMSLALLVVVGAKAYLGTRGQPIRSKKLNWLEMLFLGLTLGMNAWPHMPWSVEGEFSLSRLVLHTLGPIVAVAITMALPIILDAFARLDHGGSTRSPLLARQAPTGSPLLVRSTGQTSGGRAADIVRATSEARALIAAGRLEADPSATAIRKALRCGTDTARAVRDALKTQEGTR
ncbi:hypothetical protein ABZW11_26770 [Nonomuraea sp. NPDC004580]|uniref:hypothetical protein n=1 Tax=Nonomuraea sp. NPDC004580 TaxID=3154552 RepID=UPI0033B6CFD1